jgi:Cu-Zn family superoxide dismutase
MARTKKRRYSFKATCVLAPNDSDIKGIINMKEEEGGVQFKGKIHGLANGEHGIHIHQYGDLTEGCASACAHFNPLKCNHGGRSSSVRHLGDLGNITSKNGTSKFSLFGKGVSLGPTRKHNILGRMIVLHASRDDLGLGKNVESLITGNAGKRLACGVIGLAAPDSCTKTNRQTMASQTTKKLSRSVGMQSRKDRLRFLG